MIEYEKSGHVVTITMNRPERLNALDLQAWNDLADAWVEFDSDEDAWVGILTGTGRAFTAGMDLKSPTSGLGRDGKPMVVHPQRDPFYENRLNKPTIAAINGLCYGAGWFFAAKADFRVAASGIHFQISEIHRSMMSDYDVQWLQSLASGIATELSLGGTVTAERLFDAGFLNRVVPAEQAMASALAIADQVLALPPLAVRHTLQLMHMIRERNRMRLTGGAPSLNFSEAAPLIAEAQKALRTSEDSAEARQSFLEKRRPVFNSR